MNYSVIEKNGMKYVLLSGTENPIASEQDAITMITVLAESDTNLVLIESARLSEGFLQLRTGIAGAILQKFTTYNIKAAIVLDSGRVKGKFKDFLAESKQNKLFRAFEDSAEAEAWLLER